MAAYAGAMKHTYLKKADASMVVLYPIFQNQRPAIKSIRAILSKFKHEFSAKSGETFYLYNGIKGVGKRVMLLGLGSEKKASYKHILETFSTGLHRLKHHKVKSVAIGALEEFGRAIGEALGFATYQHAAAFKTGKAKKNLAEHAIEHAAIIGTVSDQFKKDFEKGLFLAQSTNELRDWINAPPNIANPEYFDRKAKEAADASGAKLTIFYKKQLEKMGMWALLGVNRGSPDEARLIVIEYTPRTSLFTKKEAPIVLVGKGIIFDSGGYNLKPTGHIEDMHLDKSGAATVIQTIKLLRKLNIKQRVVAIAPITENLIGPTAQKPSEIIKAYSGKTIEIANTDAEGRLVLADALAYAVDVLKPRMVIDLATLTGACMVALGYRYSGLFGNDKDLMEKIQKAGESVDEDHWPLPIHKDHHEQIKGEFADLRNSSTVRYAGASTAAAFLKEFVGKTKWAHLDIAGPAYTQTPKKYEQKGATGFGLRTLIAFLEQL